MTHVVPSNIFPQPNTTYLPFIGEFYQNLKVFKFTKGAPYTGPTHSDSGSTSPIYQARPLASIFPSVSLILARFQTINPIRPSTIGIHPHHISHSSSMLKRKLPIGMALISHQTWAKMLSSLCALGSNSHGAHRIPSTIIHNQVSTSIREMWS